MIIYIFIYIFIIQRVKARVIPCHHQPPTRSDNTVSVAQGSSATPGTTKQVLLPGRVFKRIIYIYIYIYARSTKSRDYITRSSSFLVQLVIFKNAFTFSRWCQYALTVTVPWCYVITRKWWFRVHFIYAEDFSIQTKSHFISNPFPCSRYAEGAPHVSVIVAVN